MRLSMLVLPLPLLMQPDGSAIVAMRCQIPLPKPLPKALQEGGLNLLDDRCSGTLLTGVRKSCKGRAVLPNTAHQVTAEVEEGEAVQTKRASNAAASPMVPTKLLPFGVLAAKREVAAGASAG
jgi:hypothetical protein